MTADNPNFVNVSETEISCDRNPSECPVRMGLNKIGVPTIPRCFYPEDPGAQSPILPKKVCVTEEKPITSQDPQEGR